MPDADKVTDDGLQNAVGPPAEISTAGDGHVTVKLPVIFMVS
jgi:hypothetical protein